MCARTGASGGQVDMHMTNCNSAIRGLQYDVKRFSLRVRPLRTHSMARLHPPPVAA